MNRQASWKISYVISLQPTTFSAVSFSRDLLDQCWYYSSLGYDGVELAVRDPALFDVGRIKDSVERCGLMVPAIGTGQAYLEDGLSLTCPDSETRRRTIERLKDHIRLASEFDAYVIIGLIGGRLTPGTSREHCFEWLRGSLLECADFAGHNGIELIIEPLNRYEADLVNTTEEAIGLIEDIGSDRIGLLLDTFHMNIEEASIYDAIRRSAAYLRHFHVADSNRWSPGRGHTDFPGILKTLREIGYTGVISAEILPKPNAAEAARQSVTYLRGLFREEEEIDGI